jgi:hypothetical protein
MNKFLAQLPQPKLADFCRRWRIIELALFGSALRGDFRPDSDIDVLVTFDPDANWSLSRSKFYRSKPVCDRRSGVADPLRAKNLDLLSLFDFVDMQDELQLILQRPVDLLSRRGVESDPNYLRRQAILNSAQIVYALG